jgi:hypothetical protein
MKGSRKTQEWIKKLEGRRGMRKSKLKVSIRTKKMLILNRSGLS